MSTITEKLFNCIYPGYKITNFTKDDDAKHLVLFLEPIEPLSRPTVTVLT